MNRDTDSPVESGFGRIRGVHLPDAARVFARRAARFRGLAPGHSIEPFLAFLGHLADAQAAAARVCGNQPWRSALDVIVSRMRQSQGPPESSVALDRLASASPGDLERWANGVLGRETASSPDTATTPFIAAALQVHWTSLASRADVHSLEASGGTCPVCASAPVAGLVMSGRPLRYLVCPLCATEWHVTRLTCSACGSSAALSYLVVEGSAAGVKAETCDDCRTYLKLFYLEDLPLAEAVADDVATLALDVLMAEAGYARSGASWLVTPA